MTTFLFSGWTLTFISIAVVFSALAILFGVYSLMGFIVGKAEKPKSPRKSRKGCNDEVTAAIALALEMEGGNDVAAAIALALEMENACTAHDAEPGFITINNDNGRGWNNKALGFRSLPSKRK